jgi:hypothetical protein
LKSWTAFSIIPTPPVCYRRYPHRGST